MESDRRLILGAVAFDGPGSNRARIMGKVLSSSLLRSLFDGEIFIFRNSPRPFFPVERVGLTELQVDPKADFSKEEDVKRVAIEWRITMATQLSGKPPCEWVILCDMDVVPLRNWDHLFMGRTEDLLFNKDSEDKPDPGFLAVRGDRIGEFAAELEAAAKEVPFHESRRIDLLALQKVLRSGFWSAGSFERGEIVRPFDEGANFLHCIDAAAVHLGGGTPTAKAKVSFALHMMWVYGEESGVFLDLLES